MFTDARPALPEPPLEFVPYEPPEQEPYPYDQIPSIFDSIQVPWEELLLREGQRLEIGD